MEMQLRRNECFSSLSLTPFPSSLGRELAAPAFLRPHQSVRRRLQPQPLVISQVRGRTSPDEKCKRREMIDFWPNAALPWTPFLAYPRSLPQNVEDLSFASSFRLLRGDALIGDVGGRA